MRLTQSMRDEIVRRVMNDLPEEDFSGQADEVMQAEALKALPAGAAKMMKECPEVFERRYYPGGFFIVYPNGWKGPTKTALKKAECLKQKQEEQQAARNRARRQLVYALRGVTTVKRAKEAYPDLADYLPDESNSGTALAVPSDLPALKEAGFGNRAA